MSSGEEMRREKARHEEVVKRRKEERIEQIRSREGRRGHKQDGQQ